MPRAMPRVVPRSRSTDPRDQKLFDDIDRYGWHCLHVLEEGEQKPFSFTIGLHATLGHPEVLVYGLPRQTAHAILAIVADAAKAGKPIDASRPTDDLLDGYACVLVPIAPDQYEEHLGTAIWYYEHQPFPALQIVWPNRDGIYPWHEDASASFKDAQPVIGLPRRDA